MQGLITQGYTVLPFSSDPLQHSQRFRGCLRTMPDLPFTEPPYAIGGFSALGNAGSFHHTVIRAMRAEVHEAFAAPLKAAFPDKQIQMGIDRITYRPVGKAPSREGWHRDLTPVNMCLDNDIILGGWVNMNATESQFLVCVPGTHTTVSNHTQGLGFSKLTTQQIANINNNNRGQKIEIPAGYALLFDQRLIHCVNSTKYRHPVMRMHISFRLTTSEVPLLENIREILERGAVPPLKSGQMPPMFPKLYAVNHQHLLIQESERFAECMKEDRFLAGNCLTRRGIEHREYRILKQNCPSLQEMGMVFEPYTEQEINMFFSH